jgi:hypothetical protein
MDRVRSETDRPSVPENGKPLPLALELPQAPARDQLRARFIANDPGATPGRASATLVGVLVVLSIACVTALATTFVLPSYVQSKCIEMAAAHGIALSVDEATVGGSGFRLVGVRATAAAIPEARAQAAVVEVETSGLRPVRMTVQRAELSLSGRWGAVDAAVQRWRDSWRDSLAGGQAAAWAPDSIVIERARVIWQGPIGENVRLDASDVRAQLAWQEHDAELHVRSDRVTVAVPGGTLGPWRVDVDRSGEGSRVRIALDPDVPESSTVLLVGDGERTTSMDISIPRSALAHLGLPVSLLGMSGADLQIEASAHYMALGPSRADLSAKGGIYGVRVPRFPRDIDVAWEATASGDATAGVDVKKARLAVGPLVGAVTGMVRRFADGFRLDLAWAAGPVPCAAFAVPLGLGQPFDIDYTLHQLAQTAAARDVVGDIQASLMITFDSRDLGANKVDFAPEVGCNLP